MKKRAREDPLVTKIQHELMLGHFVRHDDVSELINGLDRVHDQVEALVKSGEAARAVRLYEILLSGTYAKSEEADDECELAMCFHRLACGWIQARQAAGRSAEETVSQILNWMKNDNYGFCHRIEQEVVKVLDQEGKRLFISHLHGLLEKAMPRATSTPAKAIFDYENGVRLPAMALKEIYESLGDVPAYALMCGTLGLSPRDCERLAEMEKSRKRWAKALEWVEKGIALKPTRNWHNEDSSSLACLKPEILRKLGRKQDALASAWADFQEDPNDLSYAELMRYVPRGEKSAWHERAMAGADKAGLGDFLALCVKAQEWQRLAGRVHSAKSAELENLSHYCTEPAAKGLAKKEPLAAAKLYRALGLRILNAGKSKYYDAALDHLEKAHDLYCGAGQASEWEALVRSVRAAHSRKSGFLSAFEQLASGKTQRFPSFADQTQEGWKRLTL